MIIRKRTSSGLIKLLATHKRGFLLSLEVFDVLNKLMKSGEDNATGDIQLPCKLFSGERCSYHYLSEESYVIPANTRFSSLRFTQVFNAAKLISKMHHGHELVDRILCSMPLAFRPSLTEMESVTNNFQPCSWWLQWVLQQHLRDCPTALIPLQQRNATNSKRGQWSVCSQSQWCSERKGCPQSQSSPS